MRVEIKNAAAVVTGGASGLGLATTNIAPGVYSVYVRMSEGPHTRYLYAPEPLAIVSSLQPPGLGLSQLDSGLFRVTVNGVIGQTIRLQTSADLYQWLPLATNTLTSAVWNHTNAVPPGLGARFYRAVLVP